MNSGCLDPCCKASRLSPTPGVPGGCLIQVLNQGWAQQEGTRPSENHNLGPYTACPGGPLRPLGDLSEAIITSKSCQGSPQRQSYQSKGQA